MSAKNTDSFLRAAKPTEGQAWAHVLCAVFFPEVTFSDVVHLRLVEGISTIPRARWSAVRTSPPDTRDGHSYIPQRCTLCGEAGGAVIRCSDCIREYHVSCAWRNGHRFGFEIQPVSVSPLFAIATLTHNRPSSFQVRNHRRDAIATTFKGETGNMVPIVCCQEHDASKRVLFDMCETDETGEVMPLHAVSLPLRRTDLALFSLSFFPASAPCPWHSRPHCKHTAERTNARPCPRPTHYSGKPAASTPSSTRTASRSTPTALQNQITNATFARRSIRPAFIGAGTTPIDGTVTSVIGRCWPGRAGTGGRSRSGRNTRRPARRGRCKSETRLCG